MRGWGWGPPSNRKGWAVLVGFFGLVAAGAVYCLPRQRQGGFLLYGAGLCLLLMLVCWLTGEPVRWRRGPK